MECERDDVADELGRQGRYFRREGRGEHRDVQAHLAASNWPSSLAELSLKIGALPRSDTLTAKDLEERIVKFVLDAFPEAFRDRAPPRVRRDVAD